MESTCCHWLTETERHQVPDRRFMALIIDLVRNKENRSTSLLDDSSNVKVFVCSTHGRVHHHQDEIGLCERLLGLRRDFVIKFGSSGHPTTGIDEFEGDATPLRINAFAVASDARVFFDHRHPAPDNSIQQR